MSYTEFMRIKTEADFLTKAKVYEGMNEEYTGEIESKLAYLTTYRKSLKEFIDNTKLQTYIGETANGKQHPKSHSKVFLFNHGKYTNMVKEIQLMDREIKRLKTLKNK